MFMFLYSEQYTVYRVSWLWAKARCDRWAEELQLVELEMGWTVNWFKQREKQWMERLQQVQDDERAPGMDSYCHKQVALWTTLAKQANERFSALSGHSLLNLLS